MKKARVGAALSVALGAVVVLVVTGCGGSDDSSGSGESSQATSSTVDHLQDLNAGENEVLAAQLLAVPGYQYTDAPEQEVRDALARIRAMEARAGVEPGGFVVGLSMHSVVADDEAQNTTGSSNGPEVGFLVLQEFAEAPPAGAEAEAMAAVSGLEPTAQSDVNGTTVYLFEQPGRSESRYAYMWFRGPILNWIDGATRPELERWIEAYLSIPPPPG